MSIKLMSARPSGRNWRRVAYSAVSRRDGAVCAECRCAEATIWRRQGQSCSDDWSAPFTRVYPSSNLELDHRLALWRGGSNGHENLWLLCRDCHKAKTSREQSERLKGLFAAARR